MMPLSPSPCPAPSAHLTTDSLIEELKANNSFETREESKNRINVLQQLSDIVTRWEIEIEIENDVQQLSLPLPNAPLPKPSARLLVFGSYYLKVHSSGGDIDTVLVAPCHLTRAQFFSSFVKLLHVSPSVTKLAAIPNAHVPIIKLNFDDVDVDISFASLSMSQIPAHLNLSDDRILENLDAQSIRSLNGCRVARRLLELVPSRKEFRSAVRAVKLWAKRHGVASSAMGFFSGIAWTILVAKTCQLNPGARAPSIVVKLFKIFSNWNWKEPVVLAEGLELASNYQDRMRMPILTPLSPMETTTNNVGRFSAFVIQEEIREAARICEGIEAGEKTWKDLFEKKSFINRYSNFVTVAVSDPKATSFLGLLEAKLRYLVAKLERNATVQMAHLDTNSYESKNKESKIYMVGLRAGTEDENGNDCESLNVAKDMRKFKKEIKYEARKAGIEQPEINISCVDQSDLANLLSGIALSSMMDLTENDEEKENLKGKTGSFTGRRRVFQARNG